MALRLNHGGDTGPQPWAGLEIVKFELSPYLRHFIFFLQIFKASCYLYTFYLNSPEESIKINKKTREIWAFECEKSVIFQHFTVFLIF